MNLLKNERFLFIAVILILIGVIGATGYKIYQNNELVLQKRDKVYVEIDEEDKERVDNCIGNKFACDLIRPLEEMTEVAP